MILPRNSPKHKWRSFNDALKWVHSQHVKNKNDWKKLCASKKFPKDIPKTPMRVYAKELKGNGLGYWYGTDKKSTHDIDWRSFKEAKQYVHNLKFQNTNEYKKWATSDKKPQDIPSAPKRIYKEFVNWEDWLGNIERKKKQFLSYFEAKKWAQSKKITSGKHWRILNSQKKIPKNIPGAPDKYYEDWEGWPKFLDTVIEKMTYQEARQFVESKKITGDTSFRKYKMENKLPMNFPKAPENYYKRQGTWISWGDFTGSGRISTIGRSYGSYVKAKKFAQSLKLRGKSGWTKFCNSGKLPKDIPVAPDRTYKKQGTWISWGDFLGTGTIATQIKSQSFLSAKEAKPVLKKLFKEHNIKNGTDWRRFAPKHKKLLEKLQLPNDLLYTYSLKNAKKKESGGGSGRND
jgi:hypothetical protein